MAYISRLLLMCIKLQSGFDHLTEGFGICALFENIMAARLQRRVQDRRSKYYCNSNFQYKFITVLTKS